MKGLISQTLDTRHDMVVRTGLAAVVSHYPTCIHLADTAVFVTHDPPPTLRTRLKTYFRVLGDRKSVV